jgi:hypothetical protein
LPQLTDNRWRLINLVAAGALKSLIDYAENEAYSLEKLKVNPEAEAEAAKAWNAVETARAIIAKATAA